MPCTQLYFVPEKRLTKRIVQRLNLEQRTTNVVQIRIAYSLHSEHMTKYQNDRHHMQII